MKFFFAKFFEKGILPKFFLAKYYKKWNFIHLLNTHNVFVPVVVNEGTRPKEKNVLDILVIVVIKKKTCDLQ